MFESELADAIRAVARTTPDAVALIHGERTVSYGDLHGRALRERDRIRSLCLAAGEPVGILAAKSPESVALILGAHLDGRPFLLIPPTHPPRLAARLAEQAGCAHILSAGGIPRTPTELNELNELNAELTNERDNERNAELPAQRHPTDSPGRVPAGVSFVLTTSGSTGPPKIVPIMAAAVDRFVAWATDRFGLVAGTRVLNYAPLSFDLCLLDIWSTLARGGTAVLVDPALALRPEALTDLVHRHHIEVIQAVPLLFNLLVRPDDGEPPRRRVLPSVRHAIFTGDVIPADTLTALAGFFPAARLYNLYGATETNDSFLHEVDRDHPPDTAVPIGTPLPGVRAMVVGPDGAVLAGPVRGELWVTTPFQSQGYLSPNGGDRFGPHPDGPDGPTWYRTGDLVRRGPDGTVILVGRTDHRVKVRGVGVDIGEVERQLLTHPEVVEAAVVPVTDPATGTALLAVARRGPGSVLTSLDLRQHCAAELPRAAVPHLVRVVDDPLPRTSTGKINRSAVTHTHTAQSLEGA